MGCNNLFVMLFYFNNLLMFLLNSKVSQQSWRYDILGLSSLFVSCSHLIIEHDTQRSDRASLSHQDLSKKKKKMLSAPSQDLEAGFSLGGPATDRDGMQFILSHQSHWKSLLSCLLIIDFGHFTYSSCITSWLALEHGADEAGKGIAFLS